jgi:hypothetical protein
MSAFARPTANGPSPAALDPTASRILVRTDPSRRLGAGMRPASRRPMTAMKAAAMNITAARPRGPRSRTDPREPTSAPMAV